MRWALVGRGGEEEGEKTGVGSVVQHRWKGRRRRGEKTERSSAYLLKPRVDVWSAAGRCRCLSFDRLLRRQEITSPLINDSPRLSKGPSLHDPSMGLA